MSTSLTKKPSFNKNNYLSKNELLSWINDLLKVNLTLIEQLGSGTMYCQIMDVIYPGHIQLSKVKWGAKLEYDFIHNLKILQQCFDKLQIPQAIQVNKLAKVKYQDNLEFAQWLKAYFDFNCKDKGKGYDALKRRGNAVPYFGFCKGGVLPKTTLFYRNPNEKFTVEGFANDDQEPINEDQQEQQPIGLFNNMNQFQSEIQSASKNTQQNSFFSRKEGSASQEKSSIQVPSSGITNFFARDEGIQSKNQTPSFFKMSQSEIKPKMFFSEVNRETIAQTERKQEYKSQYFEESKPRKLNFFKPDNEETEMSQHSTLKNNNQNNLTQSFFQSASISQSFQSNNRQINNPNSAIIPSQNSVFSEQMMHNNNQHNNNIFMNSNNFTNNNISTNTLNTPNQSDKKPPFIATRMLLNKLQELTQASQTLLRRNSEEVNTQLKVGTQEEEVQESEKHVTPESKRINHSGKEEKSSYFETPVSKKLKDNYSEPITINNENTSQTQNNQNEVTIRQNTNKKEEENQNQRNIENTKKEISSFNQESTASSQSTTQTDKIKVERIQHLISSSILGDYSLILTQISKICQEI